MMVRPPRQHIDLQQVTRDLRLPCKRVAGNLDGIAQEREPLLADPRTTFIELVLAEMEIRAAIELMRRSYWPVI
jgi:hypothetical protein